MAGASQEFDGVNPVDYLWFRHEHGSMHIASARLVTALTFALVASLITLGPSRANTPAGQVDTDFGVGGSIRTPFGTGEHLVAAAVDSESRTVVAGYVNIGGSTYGTQVTPGVNFAVIGRLTNNFSQFPNNTIDSYDRTFSASGFGPGRYVHYQQPQSMFKDVAVDGSNAIYASGSYMDSGTSYPLLVKLDSDGDLDSNFAISVGEHLDTATINGDFVEFSSIEKMIPFYDSGMLFIVLAAKNAKQYLTMIDDQGTLRTILNEHGFIELPEDFRVKQMSVFGELPFELFLGGDQGTTSTIVRIGKNEADDWLLDETFDGSRINRENEQFGAFTFINDYLVVANTTSSSLTLTKTSSLDTLTSISLDSQFGDNGTIIVNELASPKIVDFFNPTLGGFHPDDMNRIQVLFNGITNGTTSPKIASAFLESGDWRLEGIQDLGLASEVTGSPALVDVEIPKVMFDGSRYALLLSAGQPRSSFISLLFDGESASWAPSGVDYPGLASLQPIPFNLHPWFQSLLVDQDHNDAELFYDWNHHDPVVCPTPDGEAFVVAGVISIGTRSVPILSSFSANGVAENGIVSPSNVTWLEYFPVIPGGSFRVTGCDITRTNTGLHTALIVEEVAFGDNQGSVNGVVVVDSDGRDQVVMFALQNDPNDPEYSCEKYRDIKWVNEKLYVAGICDEYGFVFARNADGSPDSSFGVEGTWTYQVEDSIDSQELARIRFQSLDAIQGEDSNLHFALAMTRTDGINETPTVVSEILHVRFTDDSSPVISTKTFDENHVRSVLFVGENRIVASGEIGPSGAITSWNLQNDTVQVDNFTISSDGLAPLVQSVDSSGRVVVAGEWLNSASLPSGDYLLPQAFLVRALNDGMLDSSFGLNGITGQAGESELLSLGRGPLFNVSHQTEFDGIGRVTGLTHLDDRLLVAVTRLRGFNMQTRIVGLTTEAIITPSPPVTPPVPSIPVVVTPTLPPVTPTPVTPLPEENRSVAFKRTVTFAAGSTKLSAAGNRALLSVARIVPRDTTVVCTGFTSGKNSAVNRKIAMDRAQNACAAVKKANPSVKISLKAAFSRTGKSFDRRAEVVLTYKK